MPGRNIGILHFSDLHLAPAKLAEQEFIIKKLILDLGLLLDRGEQFDFVVFSGDLVNNADEVGA